MAIIIIIIHFISGTWPIKYRTHREEKKQTNKHKHRNYRLHINYNVKKQKRIKIQNQTQYKSWTYTEGITSL